MQEQFPQSASSDETAEQTEQRFNQTTSAPVELTKSTVELNESEHVSFWQKIRRGLGKKAFNTTAGATIGVGAVVGGVVAAHEMNTNEAPDTTLEQKDPSRDINNNPELPAFLQNTEPIGIGDIVPEQTAPLLPPEVYTPPTSSSIDLTLKPKNPDLDINNNPSMPEAYILDGTELAPKDPTKDINVNPDIPNWLQVGNSQPPIGGSNTPESYSVPSAPTPERPPVETNSISPEVFPTDNK